MSGSIRIVEMPNLGAFTDTSSVVGERAGSGRFSAAALRTYFQGPGLGSWTSVMSFGAVGDGTTDDTAALSAAAAAMSSVGLGVLFFPPGNYMVSAPIALKSFTHVFGPGAAISAMPQAAWAGSAIVQGFLSTGVTDVTIDGLRFVWPRGYASFGGAASAHIIEFVNSARIEVLNCESDGGSNLTAMINCADTLVMGCRVSNFCNVAIDHWGGTTDARVIANYVYSLPSETHGGIAGISFTGINTDLTAATTTGFICTDNIVYINNDNAQGIVLNGHATGGEVSRAIIANNKVVAPSNKACWGILVTGMGKNVAIHHNYLEGSNNYSAVEAVAPASNVQIEHNKAYGWNTTAGYGIFGNTSVGGTLLFNRAISCTQPVYVSGGVVASTMIAGNDTGTGAVLLSNLAVPGLVTATNDAAAAAAGVPVGFAYRNGSQVMVRVA